MTFKKLIDELSDVSVNDYHKIIDFIKKLKENKNHISEELTLKQKLEDWTITDENWNEIEIW